MTRKVSIFAKTFGNTGLGRDCGFEDVDDEREKRSTAPLIAPSSHDAWEKEGSFCPEETFIDA